MDFTFIDNSDFFKEAMSLVAIYALTKCGMTAQKYAQLLCPVDTGKI